MGRSATCLLMCVIGLYAFAITPAFAASPKWEITAVTMPTNLPPAQKEEQQVAVDAESGTYELCLEDCYEGVEKEVEGKKVIEQVKVPSSWTAPIAYHASDSALEAALLALPSIGGKSGKLIVTGGPGGAGGSNPYKITFSGALSYVNVPQMSVDPEGLSGAGEVAVVSTSTQGGDGQGALRISAVNVGDASTSGPITLKEVLPKGAEGWTVTSVVGEDAFIYTSSAQENHAPLENCSTVTLSCTTEEPVPVGDTLAMEVGVSISPKAPDAFKEGRATVSGGGAPEASAEQAGLVTSTPAQFGIVPGSFFAVTNSSQAGEHPDLTTSFVFNTSTDLHGRSTSADSLRDTEVALPAGLIGNPIAVGRCEPAAFYAKDCPSSTLVGDATVLMKGNGTQEWKVLPVYNLQPPEGAVVDLAFEAVKEKVWVDIFAHVRTGEDYGVTATVSETPGLIEILGSTITIWGVPADRNGPGPSGFSGAAGGGSFGGPNTEAEALPFFTNPTSCEGPLSTSIRVDPWQDFEDWQQAAFSSPAITGCEAVKFAPKVEAQPESAATSSPTGLEFNLELPQEEPATSTLSKAVVTLPEGMTANPAVAGGLEACSPEQIAISSAVAAKCPEASKIGTVEVHTPLVDHPLKGAVYVATQNQNPFGSLLALYIVIDDPITGVVVKLAGEVELNPVSGRMVTRFENVPQLPFEDMTVNFFEGKRGPLATPATCGSYTVTAQLTPWAAPAIPTANRTSQPFPINQDCGPQSFKPAMTAATTNNKAGAFTPFMINLTRKDDEQQFRSVSVTLPAGVSAVLTGVPLCSEAEANAGTCSEASKIGVASAAAGVGGEPVWVTEGRVYLTGPYDGDPFGVSIVVPAVAGPFNLGNQVVRGGIAINPHTAQVTVTTVSSGAYAVPSILQGIPLYLQTLRVMINRPNFLFNPTSCDPVAVTGQVTSTAGASANVSSRFQAADCNQLGYKPRFAASTNANHSRRDGASLNVNVSEASGQANIKSVRVTLPKKLPSRTETLKHACLETQFVANPAACPPGSVVGQATVTTPLIPVPLRGPAYFVSHGGAKFPELVVVLQGYGITIELNGETSIHEGFTTSTFNAVPDVPFNHFSLELPMGANSALAGTGDFCSHVSKHVVRVKTHVKGKVVFRKRVMRSVVNVKLAMPTQIVGQDNAVVEQMTDVVAEGCPKLKLGTKQAGKAKGKSNHKR